MQKIRFFRYSGSKFNYIKIINHYIQRFNNKIYVEPFIGSGAILFNLDKEFDQYIINDIDKNIIKIYNSIKNTDYKYWKTLEQDVFDKFGEMKTSGDTTQVKKNYYNFRNWFNNNYYNTNSIDEGLYLLMLTNMVINSLLRFGPNGMNQSFGNRYYTLSERDFTIIKYRLQKTKIYCTDYKDIINKYPDALFFLDPPYYSQSSSYKSFSKSDLKELLDLIKDKDYIYTDIINDINNNLKGNFIRDMRNTAPSSNKNTRGNKEYIFCSKNDDW